MTIPASHYVQINPGVINGGGSALSLNGIMLTNNTAVPIGSLMSFPSAPAVSSFFGASALETLLAEVYFSGRNNATSLPGALYFYQFNSAAVPAYLRGGSLAGTTLSQLQAFSGILEVAVNGVTHTSTNINFSAATSFSNAAALIQAGFTTPPFTVSWDSIRSEFVVTTTATGATSTIDFAKSQTATSSACTSLSTVLTVGGTITGTFNVGDVVSGTDSTNSLPANTTIVNQLTGTPGGAGTYTISAAATPSNLASCIVTATGYSGSFVADLLLSAATGAVLSQGADIAVPATTMANIITLSQNWVNVMTTYEVTDAIKIEFAQWVNSQNNRYSYVGWTTNLAATVVPDTTTFMATVKSTNLANTIGVYHDVNHAAFVLGVAASIDFNRTNGRITFAYKYLDGLVPSVTSEAIASALETNGYNYIGSVATANQGFAYLYPGQISGQYSFADEFMDQVYLNSQLQLALLELLTQINSISYDAQGYGLIHAACMDPINQALNFGSIVPGVSLSSAQAAEVNAAAGVAIDRVLNTRGWYLQILDATAQVRAARGSPPISLWYMDGGSVQKLVVPSILIQ